MGVAREPAHLTVHSSGDERLATLDVSIEAHVGPCDTDRLEAERARPGTHLLAEPVRRRVMIGK
jgi:hypothetical protein